MPDPKHELLRRIRETLDKVYGSRLSVVVLYGSVARDEATTESDIDVLVVLEGDIQLGAELQTIIRALYPLQLEQDRPIHARPVSARAYRAGEYALYRNAQREGLAA
jgi:uncharacterized protein